VEDITPHIPKANSYANCKRGLFTKEEFRDDPDQDGKPLPIASQASRNNARSATLDSALGRPQQPGCVPRVWPQAPAHAH